jgi:hypothetical protein
MTKSIVPDARGCRGSGSEHISAPVFDNLTSVSVASKGAFTHREGHPMSADQKVMEEETIKAYTDDTNSSMESVGSVQQLPADLLREVVGGLMEKPH